MVRISAGTFKGHPIHYVLPNPSIYLDKQHKLSHIKERDNLRNTFLYKRMLAASSGSSTEKRLKLSATPRIKSQTGLKDKLLKSRRNEQKDWD